MSEETTKELIDTGLLKCIRHHDMRVLITESRLPTEKIRPRLRVDMNARFDQADQRFEKIAYAAAEFFRDV
jgi:hypothetical protein